jgi:hypothetical protein
MIKSINVEYSVKDSISYKTLHKQSNKAKDKKNETLNVYPPNIEIKKSNRVEISPNSNKKDPKLMKREPTVNSKRMLLTSKLKVPEEVWICSAKCADRDILNIELDNIISKHRKANWTSNQVIPDPLFLGVDKRNLRISHEKLLSRCRKTANTNGSLINYHQERKEYFHPDESYIHSGRGAICGEWNNTPKTFDVFNEDRAKPQKSKQSERKVVDYSTYSSRPKSASFNKLNVLKPENSICK